MWHMQIYVPVVNLDTRYVMAACGLRASQAIQSVDSCEGFVTTFQSLFCSRLVGVVCSAGATLRAAQV